MKLALYAMICMFAAQLNADEMYICEQHGQCYGYVQGGTIYHIWEHDEHQIKSTPDRGICGICGRKTSA